MRARIVRACWLVILLAAAACGRKEDAVSLEGGVIRVINQSSDAWTNIEVLVNHHYRAVSARLEPGGRLAAPVDNFVAGFGQRFQRGRQSVFLIEVKAKRADGQPVRLIWRNGKYDPSPGSGSP
jgi:hypothetical protein